jgi:hypothetical protein
MVGLLEATLAQPQAGEPLRCAVYVIAIDTAVRAASATSPDRRNSAWSRHTGRQRAGSHQIWTVARYTMNP